MIGCGLWVGNHKKGKKQHCATRQVVQPVVDGPAEVEVVANKLRSGKYSQEGNSSINAANLEQHKKAGDAEEE